MAHQRRCKKCNRLIPKAAPTETCDVCSGRAKPKARPKPKAKPPKLKRKREPESPPESPPVQQNGSNGSPKPAIKGNGICRICDAWIPERRRELHEQGLDIKGIACARQDLSAIIQAVRGRPFDLATVKW